MTVAQHAASVARWAEMFNRVEQQRDAALAEVERLRQFERICEGLPQDAIDGGWTVQGIRGYAKRLEDQLKAALARVADMKTMADNYCALLMDANAKLAEMERQEPVALANRGLHAFWVKWTEAAAGLYGPGIKLYAAPVAQAQHSVPGDIMRDAQRYRWLRDQQFYFSFSTENSDAGISSCTAGMSSRFKNLSWVDAAIDSAIAAAPGKEVGHE
ncbi:hypothetical protein [Pseudomonas aeruginosa]|uniref:hypothetical protein n=1 Tax=Pseudomonas aeruginosa TaxID=287 RepID=UPI0009416A08|nr:hypothetical protein [Pseudomonas aeruginosa]OKS45112.1 hypothetical protein BH610_04700 [Pseudomonas aeruginosa]